MNFTPRRSSQMDLETLTKERTPLPSPTRNIRKDSNMSLSELMMKEFTRRSSDSSLDQNIVIEDMV